MEKENMTFLDSLKGWGILAVIMVHLGAAGLCEGVGKIVNAGARGVQLFFIISAFLTWRSLTYKYKGNNKAINFKEQIFFGIDQAAMSKLYLSPQ